MTDFGKRIECDRMASLIDRLRIKMGMPVEFHQAGVRSVIKAYAEYLCLLSRVQSHQAIQPSRVLMDGLEVAGLALDYRCGRILPPNAAPEEIGEGAHRWTYAVFVAALLHRELMLHGAIAHANELPLSPLALFKRIVPVPVQDWLRTDSALFVELQDFLAGDAVKRGDVIGSLVKQAIAEFARRHEGAVACLPETGAMVFSPTPKNSACHATQVMAEKGTVTPPVRVENSNAANRFMTWVQNGITDRSLQVNEADALVHFVEGGMLLVSPRIFKTFARAFGEDGAGAASTGDIDESRLGKSMQRHVLRAGWHQRGENGINIQTFDVLKQRKRVSELCGVLITHPERFIHPVPAANPLLVRKARS